MKVLSIEFDDSVDVSHFPIGQEVTVTLAPHSEKGTVLVHSTFPNPEVITHTHPAKTDVGPPA